MSPSPVRHVSDAERRARLADRHALAPWARVGSVEAATRAMTVLHATEPATVPLSCRARVSDAVDVLADLDRATYADRTLVKQLAMRRTLFVFPGDLLPAAWGSASARVAATERARVVKDVVTAGLAPDGEAWLAHARNRVLALLAQHPEGLSAAEIRVAVPMLDDPAARVAVGGATRVLTGLGADVEVVRATNAGHWRTSRPRWTLTQAWLGVVEEPLAAADGYRELVRRWLRTFGPGTETDLVWWLGCTKAVVRTALAELGAVTVGLAGDGSGWLLPDDVDPPGPATRAPEHWVALLPVLDATTMGWKERGFYLGPHAGALFDRNGNAGTTAWVDGRVVGCWVQDAVGTVQVRLSEPLLPAAVRALEAEAARLTTWLAGLRIGTVYPSPAMRASDLTAG